MPIHPSVPTSWQVCSFENAVLGPFDPTPWTFGLNNNYIHAGDLWTGTWQQVDDCSIDMTYKLKNGGTGACRVVFISPTVFLAVKNDKLYRLGVRVGPKP